MIEFVLYLSIVVLRLSVICGSIRVIKMTYHLFHEVEYNDFKFSVFRLLKLNKKYLVIGLVAALSFTFSQLIEMFQVILDLKELVLYGEPLYLHIKDFSFTISCILILRCIFKLLKTELTAHEL